MQRTGHWQGEIKRRRKNGQMYPELRSISAVIDKNGNTTHSVSVFTDIAKFKDKLDNSRDGRFVQYAKGYAASIEWESLRRRVQSGKDARARSGKRQPNVLQPQFVILVVHQRAEQLLGRFGLLHMRAEYAGTLSGGQRKLLEMARALMTHPTLVLLDEPTAGVNPVLIQSLLEHVKGLRESGMTVLFVEHDMDVVQSISDWVVVVAEGRVIAEGPPGVIARNPAVIEAYLGKHRGKDVE
jgi:ABC-type sugar transport system ATPase subunit